MKVSNTEKSQTGVRSIELIVSCGPATVIAIGVHLVRASQSKCSFMCVVKQYRKNTTSVAIKVFIQ